jgi:hypothetical protein
MRYSELLILARDRVLLWLGREKRNSEDSEPAEEDAPGEAVTVWELQLVLREGSLVELDRHDAQHLFPVRLLLEDLAEFRLSRLARQEEVQRLVE